MGIYATVLSILGLIEELGQVADRSSDTLGLDIEEDRLPKKVQPRSRKRKNVAHKLGMSAADIAVYATAIEGD